MSDQWGTQEYEPDRQPPSRNRRARMPDTTDAQQAYAALAVAALTIAAVLCFFDRIGAVDVGRGVFAIAIGLFVFGGHGWTVCRAEERVRREVGGKVAELTTVLAELREQVATQRVAYLPPANRQTGVHYLSAAVGCQGRVPAPRSGLDPETIAAARSLAKQLIDGPTGEIQPARDRE